MNTKGTIKKILFVGLWVLIGSGMLILLIAAMGKQSRDTCRDYEIRISSRSSQDLFLDQADVVALIREVTRGPIKGQSKFRFDLKKIEQLLEQNNWVRDAQVYFDNRDVLRVSILEREPLARIFTRGGRSFYIDEDIRIMQLSDKISTRLPVFTGFPEKQRWSMADSLLIHDVRGTAMYIRDHPFWTSQISQFDLSPCGTGCWEMDLIPLVGDHVVKLGDGSEMEGKLNRLYTFYSQVLTKTGFNYYSKIDVRYRGQVIGTKKTK